MANLIKSVKVNGIQYGIDYESLENLPFYNNVTLGEYILPETEIEISGSAGTVDVDIQVAIENRETLLLTIDGEEYVGIGTAQVEDDTNVGYSCDFLINAAGSMISIHWYQENGTWATGHIRYESLHLAMLGTHMISLRRYSKDTKRLDRVFLGCIEVALPATPYSKNLKAIDLIGSIVKMGSECTTIIDAINKDNRFISLRCRQLECTYNPFSGFIFLGGSRGDTIDVAQQTQNVPDELTENVFLGNALVYGDGDPVMVVEAYEDSDGVWGLFAAEDCLYNTDGELAHDFTSGPITFDPSTGTFTLNGGVSDEPSSEITK